MILRRDKGSFWMGRYQELGTIQQFSVSFMFIMWECDEGKETSLIKSQQLLRRKDG